MGPGNLLMDGERIVAAGPELSGNAERVFDLKGAYILPGLVDLHVHLDDQIGRFELADSYLGGSRIAAQNGITTLCSFITQDRCRSLPQAMRDARERAARGTHCDLQWHLTPTTFEARDRAFLATLPALGWHTIKLYTTYREAGICSDDSRIGDLFRTLGPAGFGFLVHCEDDDLISGADADPSAGPQAHADLRPPLAELTAVRKVLGLARANRARLHVVHVSTAAAARALAPAREGDHGITCETCPQYLWLDPAWLRREDGHRWICSPPLREDREEFRDLARSGAFDVFATDHCPFCRGDKDDWDRRDVRSVANGLPGLGALLPLFWRLFEEDPDRAALELARRAAENPARVAGLWPRKGSLAPGSDADVAVVDPSGPEREVRSSLGEVWEPYPGFRTRVQASLVFRRGDLIVAEGQLVEADPGGRILPRFPEL